MRRKYRKVARYRRPSCILDRPCDNSQIDRANLLAIRLRQLQKREVDLATIHTNVLNSRSKSVQQFEQAYEQSIKDFDFKPGALVLVRNSSIETDLGRKSKPCYLSPMVVIRRTPNGAYRLCRT